MLILRGLGCIYISPPALHTTNSPLLYSCACGICTQQSSAGRFTALALPSDGPSLYTPAARISSSAAPAFVSPLSLFFVCQSSKGTLTIPSFHSVVAIAPLGKGGLRGWA